jgi:hypothetical protein
MYIPKTLNKNTALPVDEVTGLITYQDVVETTGNKLELFNRAIGWVNSFYVNPTDATKVRNPESGIIEIVHRFKITNNRKVVFRGCRYDSLFFEIRIARWQVQVYNE